MKIKRGSTSVRRLIFIADSSSTTGAGLANLAHNTSGLVAWYFAGDLSNDVQITLASATLGTYTSGGFVAVDNTNMPGWYEIGIPNAALDGGNEVAIQLRGAANMVPVNIYIELDAVDYQDATAFGVSRLDAAVTSRLAAANYTAPLTAATTRSALGMAAADLDTQLDAILAEVGGTSLSGPYTVTITVNNGSTAIEGAKVRMYRTGYTETKLTNASGQAAFTLDAATWSVAISAAGFTSETNTLVVTGAASQTYSLDAFTPETPTTPDTTVVSVKIVDGGMDDLSGITVQVRPKDKSTVVEDSVVALLVGTATTDVSGECEVVVPRLSAVTSGATKWIVSAVSSSRCVLEDTEFALTDSATATLGELIAEATQ